MYQPLSLELATVLPLLGLSVVAILGLAGKIPFTPSLPFLIGFVAVGLVPILFERWKYGTLGKPTIAVQAGTLVIALPNDSRGCLSISLANLQQVIVYGPEGRQYYRLMQRDGTFVEAAPMWSRPVGEAAVRFLDRRLSPVVKVTVKEPQSIFSYIRGDGP